jgi:hypothetical protein
MELFVIGGSICMLGLQQDSAVQADVGAVYSVYSIYSVQFCLPDHHRLL